MRQSYLIEMQLLIEIALPLVCNDTIFYLFCITHVKKTKGGDNMPRGDRTGPMGQGPMTGRAAGYCAGYDSPGYVNDYPVRGYGRGLGLRRGYGRGRGRGYGRNFFAPYYAYAPVKPADIKHSLENEKKYLETELKEINKRLQELSNESKNTE